MASRSMRVAYVPATKENSVMKTTRGSSAMKSKGLIEGAAAVVALVMASGAAADEWTAYGRDLQGTRYSPLARITPDNVARLELAWTFRTGDIADGRRGDGK